MRQSMKARFDGMWVRGPVDPPPVNSAPWNSVILSMQSTVNSAPSSGWQAYDCAYVRTALLKQIGLPSSTGIEFRLSRLDFWNIKQTGSPVGDYFNGLGVRIRDIAIGVSGTSPPSLTYHEDIGTGTNYAHMHYVFPTTCQNRVIANGVNFNMWEFDASFVTDTLKLRTFIHAHVIWRCEVPDIARRLEAMKLEDGYPLPSRSDSPYVEI